MKPSLKHSVFVLLAVFAFSALVMAAPVQITFDKQITETTTKTDKCNYQVKELHILEKPDKVPGGPEYAIARERKAQVDKVKSVFSKEAEFPAAAVTVADSEASQVFALIKISYSCERNPKLGKSMYMKSSPSTSKSLKFPSGFTYTNSDFFAFLETNTGPVRVQAGAAATIGWAYTYPLHPKIIAKVQPVIYDEKALKDVKATDEKTPTLEERQKLQLEKDLEADFKDIGAKYQESAFYRKLLVQDERETPNIRPITHTAGDVRWTGRTDAEYQWALNGEYALRLDVYPAKISKTEVMTYPESTSYYNHPIRIASDPRRTGQYLLKAGEMFQFQDYRFTPVAIGSGGNVELKLEEIRLIRGSGMVPDRSSPIDLELVKPDGKGGRVNIIQGDIRYEYKDPTTQKVRLVFEFSPALEVQFKGLPESIKKELEPKLRSQEYVVLTVRQTEVLDRIPRTAGSGKKEEKPESATQSGTADSAGTDAAGSDTAPADDISVDFNTQNPNNMFVKLTVSKDAPMYGAYIRIEYKEKRDIQPKVKSSPYTIPKGRTGTVQLTGLKPGEYTVRVIVRSSVQKTLFDETRTVTVKTAPPKQTQAHSAPQPAAQILSAGVCVGNLKPEFVYAVKHPRQGITDTTGYGPVTAVKFSYQVGTCYSSCPTNFPAISAELNAFTTQYAQFQQKYNFVFTPALSNAFSADLQQKVINCAQIKGTCCNTLGVSQLTVNNPGFRREDYAQRCSDAILQGDCNKLEFCQWKANSCQFIPEQGISPSSIAELNTP